LTALAWGELAVRAPELAAAGERLFRSFTVVYLATVGPDGAPRIAPVTITIHDGGLYAFLRAGTPKAGDLARDSRFALHSFPHFPGPASFDDEEVSIRGEAVRIADDGLRRAVREVHNDSVEEGSVLYRLDAVDALHKCRVRGRARYTRWPER
jgi:hypothetical protein